MSSAATTPHKKALAYLNALEADRQTALVQSEQKAEEAKLIKARQEGFRAAMKVLGQDISVATAEHTPKEPARRNARRRIPEMIMRELSFSGQPTTAHQIAKAINYNLERTEIALRRMEKAGQVHRSENDRWGIGLASTAQLAVGAVIGGNGKHPPPSNA